MIILKIHHVLNVMILITKLKLNHVLFVEMYVLHVHVFSYIYYTCIILRVCYLCKLLLVLFFVCCLCVYHVQFFPFESLLANFKNLDPVSNWTLCARDTFPPLDDGTLVEWAVIIEAEDTQLTTTAPPFGYQSFSIAPQIPIIDSTPIESTITVSGVSGSFITDINLNLNITHTWISDLVLTLIHVDTDTQVLLYNAGCNEQCEFNNIFAVIDQQQWDADFCRSCQNGCAACGAIFRPVGSLSDFNDLNPNSNWTLQVVDTFAPEDNGVLQFWQIDIASAGLA